MSRIGIFYVKLPDMIRWFTGESFRYFDILRRRNIKECDYIVVFNFKIALRRKYPKYRKMSDRFQLLDATKCNISKSFNFHMREREQRVWAIKRYADFALKIIENHLTLLEQGPNLDCEIFLRLTFRKETTLTTI